MLDRINLARLMEFLCLIILLVAWTILMYTRVIGPCLEAKSAVLPLVGGVAVVVWVTGIVWLIRRLCRVSKFLMADEVVDCPIKLSDKHFDKDENQ